MMTRSDQLPGGDYGVTIALDDDRAALGAHR